MNAPTLLVLAAGLGSRYGGIKQMDPVGPDGEFVLDYSIYDAWRAGFRQVCLVIRDELREPLREHFATKLTGKMSLDFVVQRLDDLPTGFSCPPERQKPWGTGHAIWTARKAIRGPFAAINADDFYGAESYQVLADFMCSPQRTASSYAMVAYKLANTLSEHGSVSRGICRKDERGELLSVVERTKIEKTATGARYLDGDGQWQTLTGEEPVSLNLWGFMPGIFDHLEVLFREFLQARGHEAKSEFYIPTVVDTLIQRGQCRTAVLESSERWFGMTYAEDRAVVVDQIRALTAAGRYPAPLWG